MIKRRIYYRIKPFVPWGVRTHVRRWFALRKRQHSAGVWPWLDGSDRRPVGWPGWPDGHQFAFLITHDVEGKLGLGKCQALMKLESDLGFRSSFNFVPEGEYRVSPELRNELTRAGFEVGVHDLHHDGSLHRSKKEFLRQAPRINEYVREWNAAGFRAGFMFHDLDLQHQIETVYDASTFDTDPFEPQNDGMETIYPFWVSNPRSASSAARNGGRTGYAELPYTLPQDSTLFLLFRDQTPNLWLKKLDWLAQCGGMVLVNVHPDYIRFPGEAPSRTTYPVELYIEFLKQARARYAGRFWQPLPREMAQFVVEHKEVLTRRKPRHVCIVSHSVYLNDARVARYGKSLAERGDDVEVLALRANESVPEEVTQDGVHVHHVQVRRRNERSMLSYLPPLLRFLFVSARRIAREHGRRPYDVVHVHNVPDFLVFAAWRPKLNGAKVILDIHDIVPEFFSSKFKAGERSWFVRLLKLMERCSGSFANHVILANHLWLDRYTERSVPKERCSVLINYVDQSIFYFRPRTRQDDRQIILFPGSLQWHQGLDIAIQAFNRLRDRLPKAELHIYGEGSSKPDLERLVRELNLEERVRLFGMQPLPKIAEIMANADLGVVPKRADSFGNEAYSTKIMEFMSVGVPVVVSSTKIDRFYFNDSIVRFFESGNPDAMANAIYDVLTNSELRRRLVEGGREFAEANNWEARRGDYLKLVDSLLGVEPATAPVPARLTESYPAPVVGDAS